MIITKYHTRLRRLRTLLALRAQARLLRGEIRNADWYMGRINRIDALLAGGVACDTL
jgi:hypothetical protein